MNLLNASLRHRYVIILDNSFHTLECRRFEDCTSSSFAALTMHLRVAESTQKQSTSKDDWTMKTKILSRPWKIIVGLDQTFSIILHKDWEKFSLCVSGSDYILGNCNNWNGSHRPNGCWGLEFFESLWIEPSLYSSHLKLHKFRCDQKRDRKNLFLPLLNLLPIVLLSLQYLRTLFVKGWFTSFTEKLPFLYM